jgi:hypothetical protein
VTDSPHLRRLLVTMGQAIDYLQWRMVKAPLPAKADIPDTYEYDVVRRTYTEALFEAFIGYASSGGRVTRFRNDAGRAIVEAVSDAVYRAFDDAGADELDGEDERWLTQQQAGQLEHLPGVFEWVKEQREAETVTEAAIDERVERWGQTLDSIYSEALLRGQKKKALIWHLGETEEHCSTCAKLDGQSHRAQWYLDRNYIPGKPGAEMDCGGWRCGCFLTDRDGNAVTL